MATHNGRTILLGEDDLEVRSYLETALRCYGYKVELAEDGEEVLTCLQENQTGISAVLLDIVMPRRDGLETLKEIRRFNKDLPVIMMSGLSSPLNVVGAMKGGATDFVPKPVKPDDLKKALQTVLETRQEDSDRSEPPCAPGGKHIFFSDTPCMRELQNLIGQIGWSEMPVLIQGETGVGKEIFARELNAQSPRAKKPFLKLNCAALPSELVESELFGYERGAFTGAFQKKPGIFELASGGTLLLDEIGDMDFKLQAKLLQVLQDQEFQRLGGKDTIAVNVRIIAATHRDLIEAIAQNTFREDLYHRLNVIAFRIPPLREHKQDIIALAEFLIRKHTRPGVPLMTLTEPLKAIFLAYDWPGNVRELENVIRQFLVLRDAGLLIQEVRTRMNRRRVASTPPPPEPPSPPAEPQAAPPVVPAIMSPSELHSVSNVLEEVAKAKQEAERNAILAVLKSARWNRKQAALLLNIDYKALLYKMKKLSIRKEKDGGSGENTTSELSASRVVGAVVGNGPQSDSLLGAAQEKLAATS